ncbi:MAG: CPBP family intramembrane glutamic endopeptidase [Candidatus Sulfotelmatobacter sp.]|jgi:membrane protease YdiL (CAAX protease family)
MQNVTPIAIGALALELAPAVLFGCAAERVARAMERWPVALRLSLPALFVLPYGMVSIAAHIFQWMWFALYAVLPVAIAWLLMRAARVDPEQRGDWRDASVLLVLGLAVDLRWFESAWPSGLRALNELLLVDAGLYGFLAIRQLSGTGFDFHLKWSDWKTGLRELAFFTPVVIVLGLALGFIHPHRNLPGIGSALLRWVAIFFFTAVPEELFFRAWVQNLLERRRGRHAALAIASILFGLSHFNKRSAHFNWRYVLLATIAGIFYGRAWRENRRVPASTITHASVDWLWGLWF